MKKVSSLVVIALSTVILFGGCEKDKVEAPSLSVNPGHREVVFKADGTVDGDGATFTVTTNQATWDAKSNKDWVTVSKTATGFTLSAAPNNALTASDDAEVTVSAGTATAIVIYVVQAGPEHGVVINNVKWAKYNVDAPGTFAAAPEAGGKFYQWNRKTAWGSDTWPDWNGANATGDTWDAVNDPSPEGWRLPTDEELNTLTNTVLVSKEAHTLNGVAGHLFTDLTTGNTLFLPLAGRIDQGTPKLSYLAERGYYWSSTKNDDESAFYLRSDNSAVGGYARGYGMSIRSVEK